MCKWPDEEKEQRRIDLYYHLSEVFDVRRFVQIETSREGGNLTWEKLVEEAKRQERVGKEYAKFRRENGGGGTPSYGDPALAADAISGGTTNLSRDHGHRLVAKEARARSSVINAADVMAALVRRELVQHGARSVAFAEEEPLQGSLSEGCSDVSRRRRPTQVPEARERQISWQEWKSKGQTRSLRCV